MSMRDKARNEPALVIGVIVAAVLAGSEFLIGWQPGTDWTQPAGEALAEVAAVLLGTGAIRQSVFGPKSHEDEIVDTASHAQGHGGAAE